MITKNLTSLINSNLSAELQSLLFLLGSWAHKGPGLSLYAAGPFVRDLLLGVNNINHMDLVVDGSAVDFARSLKGLFSGRLTYNERLGTATLLLPRGILLEMVTARKELFSAPLTLFSENQELDLSSLRNELFKNDFTINALACSLNTDVFGRLIDFFNGKKDLEEGMIRVLYRLRFVDDPLFILRAVRYEQRFGFTLEEETHTLMIKAIKGRLLEKVSKERLYAEVRLFFYEPSPSNVLLRLQQLDLLHFLFPRVNFNKELINRLRRLEKLLVDSRGRIPVEQGNLFILFLSLVLASLGEHDQKYISCLMRLKKKEYQNLTIARKQLPAIMSN